MRKTKIFKKISDVISKDSVFSKYGNICSIRLRFDSDKKKERGFVIIEPDDDGYDNIVDFWFDNFYKREVRKCFSGNRFEDIFNEISRYKSFQKEFGVLKTIRVSMEIGDFRSNLVINNYYTDKGFSIIPMDIMYSPCRI